MKPKTRALTRRTLRLLALVAILAAFSPYSSHTPAYGQTQDTDVQLPGIPTAVSVSVVDHDSLRIAWSAPTSGGTPSGYDLRYRVSGSDSWTTITNAAPPRTLDGLTPNTRYTVQVRAKNNTGASGWSGRIKGRTQAKMPAPGIPTAVSVIVVDHDSLRIAWSAPTSGGTPSGYDLRYRVSGSDSWTTIANAASPRTLDGLTPNTKYTVQVRARNNTGASGWSGRTKGTTRAQAPAPGVPTAVSVSVVDHDSLRIAWSAPTSGGTPSGYDLRYRVSGSDSWTTVANATSPRTLDGLTPNTRYTVQVRARNSAGASGWSGRTKGRTQATVPAPGEPTAVSVSVVDHDSLRIAWAAPTSGGTPSGYDLRYKVADNADWITVADVTSPRTLNGLTPNTKYHLQVLAKNSAGSSKSDRKKATTQAAQVSPAAPTNTPVPTATPTNTPTPPALPGEPTAVSVSVVDHDSLRIAWSAPTSGGTPSGYDLRYKVADNADWITVADVTSPRTLNGLTPNTKYHLQVLAKNSAGSSKSDRKKATTQAAQVSPAAPTNTPVPTATPTNIPTPPALPGEPTAVSVSVVDHDSLRIAWSAPTSGGTPSGYDLRYRVSGSDSWTTITNATSPRTLDGLTPNTKYTVQVRARNNTGTSGWSGRTKGRTQATVPAPGEPTAVSVSVVDHDSLRIAWSAPTSGGTPSGYDLRYRVTGSDNWTTVANAASPRTLDGLTPNTRYTVQVRARNNTGASGWSSRTKGTTQAE